MERLGQGDVSGLARPADVAAFFARFPAIVLVANSDAVEIETLQRAYGEDALFVFFNKVYKVLDRPFEGRSLLVARSGPAGANIVYRREVPDVLRLVEGGGFYGILNVRAAFSELFSPTGKFGIEAVGHLDLAPTMNGFYPATHVATSGFALALFLAENCPSSNIALAGFTAKRSTRWKLFEDHDWTFEQIVLRLLFRSGKLRVAPGSPGAGDDLLSKIASRLDGVSASDVALVTGEVLSERLTTANAAIDRLIKLTRLQARAEGWLQRLKPATRKSKLKSRSEKGA